MPAWKDMNTEEQTAFMKNASQLIKDSGLKGISVSSDGQYVLNVTAGTQEVEAGISVSGTTGKGNEAAKNDLVEKVKALGVSDLKVDIKCKMGCGDPMGVIKNANKICIDEQFCEGLADIEHKQGEVILLDLWATWCPPCQAPMGHN
jgi:hypothetical protein